MSSQAAASSTTTPVASSIKKRKREDADVDDDGDYTDEFDASSLAAAAATAADGEEENEDEEMMDAASATAATDTNTKKKVRRGRPKMFALVVSYVQVLDKGTPSTIENTLIDAFMALHEQLLQEQRDRGVAEADLIPLLEPVVVGDKLKITVPMGWRRSCRTDTGVHAARNIISLCLWEQHVFGRRASLLRSWKNESDAEQVRLAKRAFLDKLNALLPGDLRVQELQLVQPYFNAKDHCTRRHYIYVFPYKWIRPSNENVLLGMTPKQAEMQGWTDEQLLAEVNRLLKFYEGRRAFHNYTEQKEPGDDSSFRLMFRIEAVRCGAAAQLDAEYFQVQLYGASFMMHQIRKMMATVVSVMRGYLTEEQFENSLKPEFVVRLPEAPGLGLFLDDPEFDAYNKPNICKNLGAFGAESWDSDVIERIERFKRELIFTEIARLDAEKRINADWLFELCCEKHKFFKIKKIQVKKQFATTGESLPLDKIGGMNRHERKRARKEAKRAAAAAEAAASTAASATATATIEGGATAAVPAEAVTDASSPAVESASSEAK